MLVVTTWFWSGKYTKLDVAKLAAGVRRHLKQPHRFVCFADRQISIKGVEVRKFRDPMKLCKIPGCYIRLATFSPKWQQANGFDERIVWFDLDTVIVGPLDELFDRPEPFVIFGGANSRNPCPYNGSLVMVRAGAHPDVWRDFSIEKAAELPHFHAGFPDDQGWLAHKIPDAATWQAGPTSGVYSFEKPGWPWPKGYAKAHPDQRLLPPGARSVTFSGYRSVGDFIWLPWVRDNWIVKRGNKQEQHGHVQAGETEPVQEGTV